MNIDPAVPSVDITIYDPNPHIESLHSPERLAKLDESLQKYWGYLLLDQSHPPAYVVRVFGDDGFNLRMIQRIVINWHFALEPV